VAYDYDHLYAIGGSASREASPRRLATASRRCSPGKSRGPQGKTTSSDTRTANFRSSSPMASSYIRRSETPGVGTHEWHDKPNKIEAKTMVTPTHSLSRDGSSVFAPVEGARRRHEQSRLPADLSSHGSAAHAACPTTTSLSKDRMSMDPSCHLAPHSKPLGPHLAPGTYDPRQNSIGERVAAKVNPRSPGFGSSSARRTDPSGSARHRMYGGGSGM